MIAAIARKEFSEIVRDGRFKWTAAIMALLLLTAMAAGYQKYSAFMDIQRLSQDRTNAQWLNQGDKNPHAGAHYGNYAFKPAGPPGLLRQRHKQLRRHRPVHGGAQAELRHRPPGDRPEFHRTLRRPERRHDPAAADAAADHFPGVHGVFGRAGERHAAPGAQHGRKQPAVAVGQGAGYRQRDPPDCRALACWRAGLALSLTDLSMENESLVSRVALMALSYALYGAIFLFLTLAVSAWAKNARTALYGPDRVLGVCRIPGAQGCG